MLQAPTTKKDLRERNQENIERLVRVEAHIEHIEEKVEDIDTRQINHEQTCTVSFNDLRENALRLQITTENLIKAIQEQNERSKTVDEDLLKRMAVLENKLSKLYLHAVGIMFASGAVWVLLGGKIMMLLGLTV